MALVLISVRDFLLALALAWVGISFDRPAERSAPAARPTQGASAPACSDGHLCSAQRPHFDALNCDDK